MRKIDKQLKERFINGDLKPLLEYVKADKDLRLDVRRSGKAFIYYRKGLALEIGLRSFKINKKYENTLEPQSAKDHPQTYFEGTKKSIDHWLEKKKKRAEFDTQQLIAQANQSAGGKYFVVDMEYTFSRKQIAKKKRGKPANFDLVGINLQKHTITFFELKRGLNALKGKSGVQGHINDFERYLFGEHKEIFRENILADIKSMVKDKIDLGLIEEVTISDELAENDPELVLIFHPENMSEIDSFRKFVPRKYEVVIVDERDYSLGDN
jgi:hypothetical protein